MQFIKITPHSFIDVITNSSTELFVCSTDKTTDMIWEILREKWEQYNKLYDYESDTKVDDILKLIKIDNKNKKEYVDLLADFNDNTPIKVGDIVIIGTHSNSIPCDFFPIIEKLFSTWSIHLG